MQISTLLGIYQIVSLPEIHDYPRRMSLAKGELVRQVLAATYENHTNQDSDLPNECAQRDRSCR